ncbi:MAG TPA: hypothetical protein VNG11_00860 [Chloroflexota bacterium]|nr:hypothetical protein [Chloroflexota bacterium]
MESAMLGGYDLVTAIWGVGWVILGTLMIYLMIRAIDRESRVSERTSQPTPELSRKSNLTDDTTQLHQKAS